MATASISADSLLEPDVVLHLHSHPLKEVPISKFKNSGDGLLLGSTNSYTCAECHQLCYSVGRYCSECRIFFCPKCFQSFASEQEKVLEQVLQDQKQAEKLKQRMRRKKSLGITSSNQAHAQIMVACSLGDFQLAREIVDKNDFSKSLDLEETSSTGQHKGQTALTVAVKLGHRDVASLLMSRGSRTEVIDDMGMTPLMHAAYNGHVQVLDELLFAGVGVDRVAFCGYTALLFAANSGMTSCVKRLLSAKANLFARTPSGRTALIVASYNGHLSTVRLLLGCSSQAFVAAMDMEGYTAKDAAIANKFPAVETLIDNYVEQPLGLSALVNGE